MGWMSAKRLDSWASRIIFSLLVNADCGACLSTSFIFYFFFSWYSIIFFWLFWRRCFSYSNSYFWNPGFGNTIGRFLRVYVIASSIGSPSSFMRYAITTEALREMPAKLYLLSQGVDYQWTNTVPPDWIAFLMKSTPGLKCLIMFSKGMSRMLITM